jgi:DNA-directed RNA polymerase subunit H (RpoH/RPB5)
MAFDPTKHALVPKHTKLSDSEKNKLTEKFNIDLLSLPKITLTDPAISKLDTKIGDVVKIERKSKTSGISTFYRVVAEE